MSEAHCSEVSADPSLHKYLLDLSGWVGSVLNKFILHRFSKHTHYSSGMADVLKPFSFVGGENERSQLQLAHSSTILMDMGHTCWPPTTPTGSSEAKCFYRGSPSRGPRAVTGQGSVWDAKQRGGPQPETGRDERKGSVALRKKRK